MIDYSNLWMDALLLLLALLTVIGLFSIYRYAIKNIKTRKKKLEN